MVPLTVGAARTRLSRKSVRKWRARVHGALDGRAGRRPAARGLHPGQFLLLSLVERWFAKLTRCLSSAGADRGANEFLTQDTW